MIPRDLQKRLARLERARQPSEVPLIVFLDVPGKPDTAALIGGRRIVVHDVERLLAEHADVQVLRGIDPDWA